MGVTPAKLDRVAALRRAGAEVLVITDDPATAAAIAAHPADLAALVEVDSGEHRGGADPGNPRLLEVAARLGPALRGVMTHGGHSYAGRSDADMAAVAEQERAAAVGAADRVRAAGHAAGIVSVGSSPTALHARHLHGVTEVRAGVYMFGDLFQASIGTHAQDDIALTVLAAVIGLRPAEHRLLVDAGGLALSKDRSSQPTTDLGFGLVLDELGRPAHGRSVVAQAYQEHGVVALEPGAALPGPAGGRLGADRPQPCVHDRRRPRSLLGRGRVGRGRRGVAAGEWVVAPAPPYLVGQRPSFHDAWRWGPPVRRDGPGPPCSLTVPAVAGRAGYPMLAGGAVSLARN